MKKLLRSVFTVLLFVLPTVLLAQTTPTTQATNVTFTATSATAATIAWNIGNGTSRAVFVKAATTGSPAPVDGTTYTAATAFGSGTQIGTTGWYCVFNGTAATVNVTALTANTGYSVMVVEYNGTTTTSKYLATAATGNPVVGYSIVAPTSLGAAGIASTGFSVDWIANASATSGYVYDVATDANFTNFVTGYNNVSIPSSATVNLSITGLTASTPYYFRIKSVTSVGSSSYAVISPVTTFAATGFSVNYDFNSVTGVSPDPTPLPVVTNLTPGAFTVTGAVATAAGGRFNANTWTLATTYDATKYLSVALAPTTGNNLTLNSLTFTIQRSTTSGPAQYSVRSSIDNYATDLPGIISPANAAITVSNGIFTNSNTTSVAQAGNTINFDGTFSNLTSGVTFRIYAFAAGSATTGTFSVDNVKFTGVVGPPPVTTTGYPKANNGTNTTIDFVNNLNKVGTTYYVVSTSATPPTTTQIKAGNDAAGTALKSGTLNITAANADATVTITGLASSTTYYVYSFSQDNAATPIAQTTVASSSTATSGSTVSTDATLSGLALSAGSLTTTFSSATLAYTANVGYSAASTTITPTVNQGNATVQVKLSTDAAYTTVSSGNPSQTLSLAVGTNTVNVLVTAQDGTTTKAYTITVNRATASTDATLSGLTISAGTLTPATFAPATTSYTAAVNNTVTTTTVTPTVNDATATVQVKLSTDATYATVTSGSPSSALALAVGNNIINVLVTAQNGSSNTYTITVTRALAVPTLPTAAAGLTDTQFNIDWIPTTGATSYAYDVSTDNTFTTGFIANNITTTATNATITGLTTGTAYYFRLRAVNSAGTSASTSALTVTTLAATNYSASYDFSSVTTTSGTTDPTPAPVVPGITFGAISANGVTTNSGSASIFNFTNWPSTTTIDATKYYAVTVTPASGYNVALSTISFSVQRSSTGAANYSVRSSADNFATDLPASVNPANGNITVAGNVFTNANTSALQTGSTVTPGVSLTAPVTFQIYGYNASGTGGTFRLDDVKFTGTVTQIPAGPGITSTGTLTTLSTTYGTASSAGTFNVSGSGLTAGIVVTPPSGFEVSTDNSTFTATATLAPTSGTVASSPIYIRLAKTTIVGSAYSGNVVLSSTGATSVTVATATSSVTAAALTITASNVTKIQGNTLTGGAGSTAFTAAGLQNSEAVGTVTIAYGTGSAAGDAVATYTGQVTPSAATGGTFIAGNYTITYVAGDIVVQAPASPVISSSTNTLAAQSTTYGTASTAGTFNVSGVNMTAGILVTPPAGFEVSLNNTTFGATVTVSGTGTIASTPVYVRLAAIDTAKSYSGNVALTSAGATENDIAITASTVSALSPTATTVAATAITNTAATLNATINDGGTYTTVTFEIGASDAVVTGGTGTSSDLLTGTRVNRSISGGSGNITASFAQTGLTANTTYYYRVKAVSSAGTVYGSTLNFTTVQVAPTASISGVSGTSFSVNWVSVTGATGYNYDVSTENTFTTGLLPSYTNLTTTATGVSITGLSSGNTYYFRIKTVNGGGGGAYSTPLTAVTSGTFSALYTFNSILSTPSVTTDPTPLPVIDNVTLSAFTINGATATGAAGRFAGNNWGTAINSPFDAAKYYAVTLTPATGFSLNVSAMAFTLQRSSTGPTKFVVRSSADGYTANLSVSSTNTAAITADGTNTLTFVTTATTSGTGTAAPALTGLTSGVTFRLYPFNDATAATTGTFSVDNVQFTGTTGVAPTISSTGTLSALSTIYGTASASGTFNVSGSNMSAGILVTPPSGFEVSLDNSTFTSTVTVSGTGTIASTPVYIRLAKTTVVGSAYTGNIVLSSTGAASVNVATATSSVTTAPLTITASVANKTYGSVLTSAAGSAAFTATGLVNAETIGTVTLTYGTGSSATDAVSTYTGTAVPSLATGGNFTAGNYNITYAGGNIVVAKANLAITASTATKVYGTSLTNGAGSTAFTSTGLQNSEVIGSVSLTYGTGASTASAVGTYTAQVTPGLAVDGTFSSANYNITYNKGDITVTAAPLTLTANLANKTYGNTLTSGSSSAGFTATGLANGESVGSVTLTYGTGSAATAAVNTYTGTVVPSLATGGSFTASNYTIGYTAGNIIVGQAILTITATGPAKTAGTALTAGTSTGNFTTTTTQNSEVVSSVTLTPDAAGQSASTAAGTAYTVTPSAATGTVGFLASNYNITYVPYNGTVSAAPSPTISRTGSLSALSTTYGTASTSGTFNISGTNMTAGILVTPPAGFEVSTDNATFNGSVTVGASGTIASTPVYIRLKSTTTVGSTYSGNVVLTSSGATGVDVAVPASSVATANLIVTALNANKNYGVTLTGSAGSTAFTSTGLVNGENIGSVTIAYGTGAAGTANVNTYTGAVTASAATGGSFSAGNYNITYNAGNIIIGKASLNISASDVTKTQGTTLTGGAGSIAFTSTGLANGETVGSVTVAYGTGSASGAGVGTYTSSVTISAATGGSFVANNYNIVYTPGDIIVTATPTPTISATGSLAALSTTYGTASATGTFNVSGVNMTAGILVTAPTGYEVSSSASIGFGSTVTIGSTGTIPSTPVYIRLSGSVSAGSYSNDILLSSSGATTVNISTSASTVSAKAITITANAASKTYGSAITGSVGSTAFTATGLINTETVGTVTIAYGTGSAATAGVNTYTGSVVASAATGGSFNPNNYTITYVNGNITVNQAALSITATNKNKTYGTSLVTAAGLTDFTSTGLQNGESIGSVTLTYGTGAASSAAVATYASQITPSAATGGSFTAGNYSITYNKGDIVVGKATLAITASAAPKTYGSTLINGAGSSAFTATGLANSETIGSVTLTYGTGSAAAAGVGTYTGGVVASAATGGTFNATNYTINYTAGDIVVGKATLSIIASNTPKTYGTTLTGTSGSIAFGTAGLASGETIGSVTLTYGTGSAATAAVNTYTGSVVVTAATGGTFSAGNYNINYVAGNIVVGQATLVVSATNALKAYGSTLTGGAGSTAFTSTGLANGESIGSITVTYGAGSAATAAVNTYTGSAVASAATGGTFTAGNYNISYTGGNIIIGQATLNITASNAAKIYGTALTSGTGITAFTSAGLVNGETIGSITATYGTGSAATAAVNTYTGSVVASAAMGGTFTAGNYNITYTPGNIIVGKATLAITASNALKAYGATLTGAAGSTAFTSTGLANSETVGSVTLTYGTGSVATAAVNTYSGSVVASAATGGTFNAANYNINYAAGDIIVGKSSLTISANNAAKAYGTIITGGAGSTAFVATGLANGETIGSITIAYGTGASATAAVNTYSGSVVASAATGGTFNSSNYTIAYTAGDIVVGKATLIVTANNATKTYGTTLTNGSGSSAFTSTGLANGETMGSVTITYGTGASATAAANTYTGSVVASAATGGTFAAANYNISYTAGNIIVGQAALNITANNATKAYGVTLTGGAGSTAFTSAGLVNGESIGTVTLTYGSGAAATAAVNTYAGSVVASAATGGTFTAANYNINYTAGNIIVGQAVLIVTASSASKVYGSANPALTVSYSGFVGTDNSASLTTAPTVSTVAVTTSPVGTYATRASGAVSPNYTFTYLDGSLTVTPATLTATASSASKIYGAVNPALTVSYSGFVGTDNAASLTTAATVSTTAVTTSAVGTYPTKASGATSTNYTFTYVDGALNVTQATLNVTASSGTKVYGAVNPALTATYTGFVGTDNAASLNTAPTVSTTATTTSVVGSYPTTATGGVSANYTFNYIPGNLTVTAAVLSVIASSASKVYGTANPALAVTYAGFVGADNAASLTTAPTVVTTATTTSPVGTYPITASGAVSPNYTFAYTAGTLTVTQAALTVTVANASKNYGAVNPAFTVAYSGFVGADNASAVTTAPVLSTTAITASPAGTYPITASGAVATNYTFTYLPGVLTVNKATLTITANNVNKNFGTALTNVASSTAFTSVGLIGAETIGNVSITYGTGAAATAPVGTYPGSVTPAAATGGTFAAGNYNINYVSGDININQGVLTITASSANKVYGTSNPALTVSYSGFVGTDNASSFTKLPTVTVAAGVTTGVGAYPTIASGATIPNYTIVYVNGALTITPAPLLVAVDSKTKVFGAANPALTYTASGFVGSDSQSTLTALPTLATTATATSAPGTYPITASGAAGANYNVTYTAGTLTVTAITNAAISTLAVSDGKLSPAFINTVKVYTDSVSNSVSSITLTPTLADGNATVKVNNTLVANGSASNAIPLNIGNNVIYVVVTAQDGVTQNTFTITVYRGLSQDAVSASNILSPNGDGKNDNWVVKDILLYPNNNVTVYDRGGRVVFSKHGYANEWTGTLQGAPLSEGTYYYTIDLGPNTRLIKGFVTILRNR